MNLYALYKLCSSRGNEY
ncbi:hypothetical protein F383_39053 [Gossypium arboreum]|uniref:Uncharacterized protein n=1 Tax=Gossypium arboreum TaxID=29729 RepID=A0A0B0MES8_GOSAR|nr:hypothetical protein F383_39053 [Gossypium arboreum]